jgi:lipopolysaccharide export system permease protein
MKIFTKSVVEEYTIGALLIFASLLAIAGVTLLVRYLGQAASGAIPVTSIFMFLILSVAKYLPTLVNLSVFLGITVCLMRVYRESEMIIWLSSGRSIFSWLSPTVRFLIPMLILSAIFSFILAPWADGKRDELKRKIESTEDISVLSEGEFIGSSDGKRIFYVDKIMQNGTLSSAFVFSENDEEKTITVSERGTQRGTPLGTFIILDSGRAYRFYKEKGDIDLTAFDEEGIRLQSKSADRDLTPHGALQTNLLFLRAIEGDRAAKAEMIDRAAYPISLFFLALLSIPIARRRVRSSKNFAIANAILFFFLYQNLIAIFNLKVVTGETSTLQGILFPHGLVAILTTLLFLWREDIFHRLVFRLVRR